MIHLPWQHHCDHSAPSWVLLLPSQSPDSGHLWPHLHLRGWQCHGRVRCSERLRQDQFLPPHLDCCSRAHSHLAGDAWLRSRPGVTGLPQASNDVGRNKLQPFLPAATFPIWRGKGNGLAPQLGPWS